MLERPDLASDTSPPPNSKPPVASGGAARGGSDYLRSTASWRYASVGNSADSDAYSGLLASVAADAGGTGLSGALGADGGHAAPLAAPPRPAPSTDGNPADRQLWSPSKRPGGHMAVQAGPADGGAAAPPGLDPASFAAGERAALMRAFQQALPGQQALGQLFSAVDALHSRLEEEAAQWRQLQLGSTKTSGMVETALQRLDALEFMRLPQVAERAEQAAARPPEQLLELLRGLQQVVALLTQQRHMLAEQQAAAASAAASAAVGGVRPRGGGALHWLLLAAAGYGQSLLSKADVAALVLSRKILLMPSDGDEQASGPGKPLQSTLSVLLFVAAVEGAWQAQLRLLRPLPAAARRAAAPLQLGLRLSRAAVWSAALVLAAAHTRASCHAAGASICGAAEAAAAAARLPAWAQRLPAWLPAWLLHRLRPASPPVKGAATPAKTPGRPATPADADLAAYAAVAGCLGGQATPPSRRQA